MEVVYFLVRNNEGHTQHRSLLPYSSAFASSILYVKCPTFAHSPLGLNSDINTNY